MVLDRYRSGWESTLSPVAARFHRWGVTPNALTVASFLFAVAAGVAFLFAREDRLHLLLAGAVCVSINAVLDGLDGRLARLANAESRRGDYLDHVLDRYSDAAILVGLTLSPMGSHTWGVLAIAGTFLTSYMGTQAQALGLGRNYGGWLGRADRLVILLAVPALVSLASLVGLSWPWTPGPLVWMLVYLAVVGHLTALQRFWAGWRALG
ncbi:MAG TPA: CDP-alcohol phosphatidyltransferase family protein [Candidatus Thermoplasmatota archaeon]|nr:CDP-alcohol phosphatidyltransferase family protein [Candidatus Thermoplasmatota archaeon]